MKEKASLISVGWREFVDIEEWGVSSLRVKIDTGARTSSIHVRNIEELENDLIRFEVVIQERPEKKTLWVTSKPVRTSIVKPSSGEKQTRYVCKTKIKMGNIEKEIEISLVSRKGMLCRMLIGRTALSGSFIVDPSKRYLLGKRRKK